MSDKDIIRAEILSGEFNRRLKSVQYPSVELPLSAISEGHNYELTTSPATQPVNGIVNTFSPSALLDKETQDGGGSDMFPWRDVETPTADRKHEGGKHNPSEQFIDPTVVQMEVEIKLPVVSLELTYDVAMGSHLILAVRKLEATMLTRAYDRRIVFDLSELSIQDSFRAESQSYLAWTPTEFGNLIHVSYVSLFSQKSPLYSKYGTEVNIDFAHLCLNIDVNTLLHLKPFFDVLLGKASSPSSGDKKDSSDSGQIVSPKQSLPFIPVQNNNQFQHQFSPAGVRAIDECSPSGMLVTAQLSKISLEILRCPALEKKGMLLEPTFSIEISKLSAVVNFMELLTATIRLKSFLIRDIRAISEDYIYRIVMLPTAEDTSGLPLHTVDAVSADTTKQQPPSSGCASDGTALAESSQDENLLHLSYRQESKSHSELTVNISNVTSFVSLDALLDLMSIASANFFTLLAIVSGNNAKKVDTESKSRSEMHRSVDAAEAAASSRVTMSVLMNVNTPRIILLEDPSSRDSKAIVCRCGIIARYTRETTTIVDPLKKLNVHFVDSLHVSLQKVEVFVIRSMSEWKQKFVLQPVDIECHFKRKSVDSVLESSQFTIEMDNVDARLSFHDLVLASTILSRRALIESTPPTRSKQPSATEANTKKSAHSIYDRAESCSIDEDAPARRQSHSKASSSPLISYRFGLSSLVLVTVNDFDGQNIPILKMSLEETKISYEQDKFSFHGEGSVDLSLDFYNSKINLWEPLLERWLPSLRVYPHRGTQTIEISSEQTLQLTVSGIMLETLMRSYTLLFQQYSGVRDHESSDIAATTSSLSNIEVHNDLGDDIGIELQDSTTGQSLLILLPVEHGGSAQGILKSDRPTVSSSYRSEAKRPSTVSLLSEAKLTSVNLHFLGYLEGERSSLLHLPLNLSKPKAYALAPNVHDPRREVPINSSSKTVTVTKENAKSEVADTLYERLASEQPILLEPVVEEVYQNSRYDPLSGQWKAPYLFGDPYEWTDATGSRRKDLSSIDIQTSEPSCEFECISIVLINLY